MSCFKPLPVWILKKLNSEGKKVVVFSQKSGREWSPATLPCGRCIGCRLAQAKTWAIRCVHEASLHPNNCFITLTYSDDNLRVAPLADGTFNVGTLVKRDIQLFMKSLRKRFPCVRIRFFCCGEYGAKLFRPHYHLILFGFDFHDKVFFKKTPVGSIIYRSALLEERWKHGYSSVADVTLDSAAYVARYCLKKRSGDQVEDHYKGLCPEFSLMSRKPGIAREWLEQFSSDVYPHDYVVISKGIKCKPPRYYDKIYDLTNAEGMHIVREVREQYAKDHSDDVDNSYDRIAVQESVQESKLTLLERSLENET